MRQNNPEKQGSDTSRLAEELGQHRRDIEALDRRILHLVCERLELARQIGDLKRRCRVPLRNFEVEARVVERFRGASGDLGLDASLGTDLALFLIAKAVEEQASQMDADYSGDELSILVVGGKGGMGSWTARFLAGQGHRVSIHDPATGDSRFPVVECLDSEALEADLIIVAVPMAETLSILERLSTIGVSGIVAEMCSLKAHLFPRIDELRDRGLRLVSFHPLFGPKVRMLSGRTIVFCNDAPEEQLAAVKALFEDTSAELVEMKPADHDRRMAVVLGMTHLTNLAFARALEHSGIAAGDLKEVAGVTFQKQLATTFEVSGENPDLYFQIQALNGLTEQTADWLVKAVGEWRDAVASKDAEAFASLMIGCRDFLGEELERDEVAKR